MTRDPCRRSGYDGAIRHIARDHSPGANDCIRTNPYARQYHRAGTNQGMGPDADASGEHCTRSYMNSIPEFAFVVHARRMIDYAG